MQQAFLIIIAVVGAIYGLFTKQVKTALGFLIIGVSFIFVIPDIVTGIWVDVFGALSMIFFAIGVFVIIFKKKAKQESSEKPQNENADKE